MDAQLIPDPDSASPAPDSAPAPPAPPMWRRPPVPPTRPASRKRLIAGLGGLLVVLVILGLAVSRLLGASQQAIDTASPSLRSAGLQQLAVPQADQYMFNSTTATDIAPSSVAGGTTQTTAPDWGRKIIRNGQIDLVVTDVANSLAAVHDLAAQAGGLVFSSNSQYQGDTLVASVTLQVPVETFDQVMAGLRKLGVKVTNETSSSQDVGEEYTDLTSQLTNLQTQEEQLRLLMGKATTVDETLTVQRELGQVRGDIEKIQGRMNYLDHHAALSSITVNLSPKPLAPAASAPPPGWQPEATVARAWDASLAVLTNLGDLVLTVAVFSWWLVPVLLLGGLLLRRRRFQAARAG